jgi:transaldolase
VGEACDLFAGVYRETDGLDGYVSLEIDPRLANDKEPQLREGLRLWKVLGRPNAMIKVPAAKGGMFVIEELIARGVNVNATLIFSAEQYQQVAWAYLRGLKKLAAGGGDLSRVRSVASVFVSRIDAAIDPWLDQLSADVPEKVKLRGKAAVANSLIVYHKFQKSFSSDEFTALASQGAHPQRVLWASTGTKDPAYSDIKYITELIGAGTVNTAPEKTLMAFLDHGTCRPALPGDVAGAQKTVVALRGLGKDVGMVCNTLLEEGLAAFVKSFDELLTSIEAKKDAHHKQERA